jgi:hypothetical protein
MRVYFDPSFLIALRVGEDTEQVRRMARRV